MLRRIFLAASLVSRKRYTKQRALARFQARADQRVLGDRDESVISTDYWTYAAAPATLNGSDSRTFTIEVGSTTQAIKALVSYPFLGYVSLNPFDYSITLADAAGRTVATSTPASNAGMSGLFVDLTGGGYAFGSWTVSVRGEQGAQDQDVLMGYLVSATGSTTFFFTPGAAGLLTSPEGCNLQAGTPVAGLSTAAGEGTVCNGTPRVCNTGPAPVAGDYSMSIPPITLPAGSRLSGWCARRARSLRPHARCMAARVSPPTTPMPG